MSQTVTIQLTPENESILNGLQEREPIVLDDLFNRALSNYFFAKQFDDVRARLSKPVPGQPQYTEDQILDMVS